MIDNRLNRFFLLTRCVIRAIFFGKAVKSVSAPFTVIVVLTGKLGDIVCGTPVLKAIRDNLPNTRIIVAKTSEVVQPLLSHSGLVDDYIDFSDKNIIKEIKKHNVDVGIVTGPSFLPSAILYLSKIPLVVIPKITGGFSPFETYPLKILQLFVQTFSFRVGVYALREKLRALEPLGIFEDNTTKHLGYSKEAEKKTKKFFQEQGIDVQMDFLVGISPTAGNKVKEWPTERFTEVANYLHGQYKGTIVIIGGSDDKEYAEAMKRGLNKEVRFIDTTGVFSIDELKSLISKLKMFISVDTGPLNIAQAFGVPTIDILGPAPEWAVQRGSFNRIVTNREGAEPAIHPLNNREIDYNEGRRQVEAITVKMVTKEIRDLYQSLPNK